MDSLRSYTVPSGKLAGRRLGDLNSDEQAHLRRTRVPELEEARAHLRTLLSAGRSASLPGGRPPLPAAASTELPEACFPLVLWRPSAESRPAAAAVQPLRGLLVWAVPQVPQWVKLLLGYIVVCLFCPPMARVPGILLGLVIRTLASRARECGRIFWASLLEQMGDLATDALLYVDSWVLPASVVPHSAQPVAPGQSLILVALGWAFMKQVRPFG